MSRSVKKHAYVKDSSNSSNKKIASKKVRRVTKNISKEIRDDFSNLDDFEDDWLYPHGYELTNPYDICDFVFPITKDGPCKKKLDKNGKLRK